MTDTPETILFNRPLVLGPEYDYIAEAVGNMHLSGDGPFTKRCEEWLETRLGSARALLTHSCTGALDMAALLLDVQPGDEVIMPSFTFPSTANAFVLRGCVPVFVDIRSDTLNLDEQRVEQAITPRTRAIAVVHYAGVACDMGTIGAVAAANGLAIVEDAAQALLSAWRGKTLGSFGNLAALSFHETKNVISGEGGALLVNHSELVERAEIVREKGTDRSKYFRGAIDKYSWVDIGSSFLPSDITAAFLWAQLEAAEKIQADRLGTWEAYHERFGELEWRGYVRRPVVPPDCTHNGHMYYLLLAEPAWRDAFIRGLAERGVNAVSHYMPLHSAQAGRRFGRPSGDLPVTDWASEALVRLPLWVGMPRTACDRVADAAHATLEDLAAGRRAPGPSHVRR